MKLNGATIPDAIVRRVIEFRGAEHSFVNLDPARTALVVIDLQHAFMNDTVGFAPVPRRATLSPRSTGWLRRCARLVAASSGSR